MASEPAVPVPDSDRRTQQEVVVSTAAYCSYPST